MNSLKIAYLALQTICELFFFTAAVVIPVWVTPGHYWWTAMFLILAIAASFGATKRVNSWGDMGHVDET